jgi:hypothetical protein
MRWYLDNYAVNQLKRQGGVANVIAAAASSVCSWVCSTILVGAINYVLVEVDWGNNHSGSNGVNIDPNYPFAF